MLCLECNHRAAMPGLVLAMEQREHFALVRHAEVCPDCASKMYRISEKFLEGSRYRSQSINCGKCGANLPSIRLKFDLGGSVGFLQVALCADCYKIVRENMMFGCPNLVGFVDKEWETHKDANAQRMPWPKGTKVKVRHHVHRFHDKVGIVQSIRGLVIPYFGYDVCFEDRHHHFFHERDLEPLPGQGIKA